MQIPEFMAGGQGRHQQFLGIPARGIAAKGWIGRSRNRRFPGSGGDLVAALVVPISGRAGAGVARPVHGDGVAMRFHVVRPFRPPKTTTQTPARSAPALPSGSSAGGLRPGSFPRRAYRRLSVPDGRAANQPFAVTTFSPPMGAPLPGAVVSVATIFSPGEVGGMQLLPARASATPPSARAWPARRCARKPARRTSPSARGRSRRDRGPCVPGSRPPTAP